MKHRTFNPSSLRRNHTILVIALLAILLPYPAYAATLTASVNRTNIAINEALILTVSYDQQIDSQQLDLSPLTKDFQVLNSRPQSSSNISIINGKTTRVSSTTWQIGLVGKREGKLTIPALNIGGASSKAIIVTVSPAGSTPPQERSMSASLRVNKREAHPGEQILITIELAIRANVGNVSGEPFNITGGNFELLDQQQFERVDNGIAKQVVTWKYAAFADAAGTLKILAQTFTGLVGGRRSLFDNFGSRGEQVIARTKAKTITINPLPDADGATWFTANNVSITSKWSGDTSKAKVGEPITRTLAIVAQGQKASAIPPLTAIENNSEFRAYSDQAQLDNRNSNIGITGTRTETTAIVPNIEGELTLPEQRLRWWNSKAKRWQEAVLPAQTITVEPGSTLASNPIDTAPVTIAQDDSQISSAQDNTLWKLATLLLALICIVQSCLLFAKGGTVTRKHTKIKTNENAASAWKNLQTSLKKADPAKIRADILTWSKAAQPELKYHSIQELARLFDQSQDKAKLLQLDNHLYKGDELDLKTLSNAIKQLKSALEQHKAAPQEKNTLKPLYPS